MVTVLAQVAACGLALQQLEESTEEHRGLGGGGASCAPTVAAGPGRCRHTLLSARRWPPVGLSLPQADK